MYKHRITASDLPVDGKVYELAYAASESISELIDYLQDIKGSLTTAEDKFLEDSYKVLRDLDAIIAENED